MVTAQVESIHGTEPMREREYPLYFKVGQDGVTRIEGFEYSPEPYCTREYYHVYKGDAIHARINDHAIAAIYYMNQPEALK